MFRFQQTREQLPNFTLIILASQTQSRERLIPYPEKTFVYDFATYNKNTTKYEAAISTESGSEGDTIVATKEEGGLGFVQKHLR